MQIEVATQANATVAHVSGEIDGKTAPEAQAQLLPVIESCSRLVMEMSGVTYMSSAGLRMLLLVYRQATAKDAKVVLVGLSDEIKDTMSMTGFLDFFALADSVEAGLEA